ncbi:hypothetical protein NDU88_004728 [Pleurodeles waltl]|uniref:Uncharacterized protein n=1 Tax=Pleurodeles waltl TaxID=8319 RepID=A0AAV7WXI1_PLEWA|nr:hypothetical protein NDU88_004728 [Pleurodeles waltl]
MTRRLHGKVGSAPYLNTDEADSLGWDLIPQEIRMPGMDGFLAEFFVMYSEELTPKLVELYGAVMESGNLSGMTSEPLIVPRLLGVPLSTASYICHVEVAAELNRGYKKPYPLLL